MDETQAPQPTTPHADVVEKTITVEILGKEYQARELIAIDIADLEDKANASMSELQHDPSKRNRMRCALAMVWVCVRKSGLAPDAIRGKRWAISWSDMETIPYGEVGDVMKKVAPFFGGGPSEGAPPE